MSTEDFNALPIEARQYIINQQGCLSCGKAQDLDALYRKFLNMQKQSLYTLRVGAVSYKTEDGKHGVLYPINPKDTQEQILEKLEKAVEVYAVAPQKFSAFNEPDILELIGATAVEDEEDEAEKAEYKKTDKPLYGAAKKAAEAKAAKAVSDLD